MRTTRAPREPAERPGEEGAAYSRCAINSREFYFTAAAAAAAARTHPRARVHTYVHVRTRARSAFDVTPPVRAASVAFYRARARLEKETHTCQISSIARRLRRRRFAAASILLFFFLSFFLSSFSLTNRGNRLFAEADGCVFESEPNDFGDAQLATLDPYLK